jgi:hypothetical protein
MDFEVPAIISRAGDRLKSGIAGRAIKRFSIPDGAVRNFRSLTALAGPSGGGLPTEFASLGACMWSGFALTPFAQQQMEGWVLPYWLVKQCTPGSPSFVPHGHGFLAPNMTHRNWTGVGLCGYPYEGMVDPAGLVTPWPFGPSIDVWVMRGDELHHASALDDVEQTLVDSLPLVRTSWRVPGVECSLTTWVAPLDTLPLVISRAEVTNKGRKDADISIIVSVRPYNPESILAINHLEYSTGQRLFKTDGNVLAYLPTPPAEVLLSDYEHGDVALLLQDGKRSRLPSRTLEVNEPVGLATGAAVYPFQLEAGESASVLFSCPLQEGIKPPFARLLPTADADGIAATAFSEQLDKWGATVSEGMRVKVPEVAYQEAFDSNKMTLLLLFDGTSITPGTCTYHMMWFRDAAYLVPALERMGHADKAQSILMTYPDRQTPEGFFRSHNGEWDSNGQAMWTLVNHYRMTGNKKFLRSVYDSLPKAARWLDDMRVQDLPSTDPARGLLPNGISAEHFGINGVYYWDDLWAVGGLRASAFAAKEMGRDEDARYMEGLADEYMSALESSWAYVARKLGREVMPISPFRDVDWASIGSLVSVYPLHLLDPRSEIMKNTVKEIVAKCFYRDTHYHGIFHCGLNPYLSMHVAQYYLELRDPYALTIFESMHSMATSTFTYPEAINPLTMGGAFGDGHDGWSACDIFNFVRNLFVLEEDDTLTLLALSKPEWFEPGETIEVEDAPTYFGDISYTVRSAGREISFELPGRYRVEPRELQLNLPLVITGCVADGQEVKVRKEAKSVEVPPSSTSVTLTVERGSGA